LKGENLQTFSIQTKLLVFVTSLVVIPGAIYGAVAVSRSRAALAHTVGQQLVGEARNAADRLTTALRSHRDNLSGSARQDVMREIRIGDLDKRISSFLTSLKGGCPTCLDFLVLDREGRVLASSNPSLIGRPVGAHGGVPVDAAIEGPIDAPDHGRSSLRFSVSIPDPDAPAAVLGWLIGLVDWERETDVTTRVRDNLLTLGINADVLVLDDESAVVGGAPRSDGRWQRGDIVGFAARRAPGAGAAARVEEAAGVLVGHAGLPDDLPRWTILVAEPLAEAFAPVQHMARLLGGVLVVTLLAALGVAFAAVRRVTRPLAELTEAAAEVGRGGTPTPTVVVRSRDEIGTLATAFNRMAADLHRAERRLVDAAKFAFVGELAAGVAHEVRTPLGVLRSSAQLLERSLQPRDEDARELLLLVRDEVDRIERVVSGLLELGRPRELRLEPARLGQIVLRAADFIEIQARAKGLTLSRRPFDSDPVVSCDPELVYQVALNLLVNAVQILAPGGAIELALLPPSDGYAGFEVRDDGPGIPEDLRATLFQPFATRREGGIGLGLTFVQRVVLEHHGRLAVSDANGRGTVFRVELPTVEVAT
jgi:signal transduction histidine kinase